MWASTNAPADEIVIEAVVTKADGSIVKYGTVSYYHRNPLKRLVWFLRVAARRLLHA